ncbi:oxidoreductase [Candidatus Saganbacteria bacterium CG08_land_8_20_14_0_20_45_16]|uniref:Oxidoreductase n=1 Tax=Candidatus Saganbacteria bacterium CG08_land_8_20_14_0_20_45_16 TaxID=2014293 RepID=A0A2H0Y0K7_UNCSA|nr:MAG: oxidoreductase [Candidatus Saganbacteria bacterium CG08_land_8_20_14_0_20_45_16]
MRQLIQNYKSGELQLVEVPDPILRPGGVVLETKNSLVSVGTEKLMISLAQKGYIGKAMARPDLVKQVINKIKVDGLVDTYKAVMSRLDTPVTLGYSSAGVIREMSDLQGPISYVIGDRIACFGDGFATHSELSFVPKNMFVKIPDNVFFEEAAFVGLGSIALNAIRVTNLTFGEKVVVVGLGLLGQLTVQMLKAFGCQVLGVDISEAKLKMAREFGANLCLLSDVRGPMSDVVNAIKDFTGGIGADAVIIMAGSQDNKPIEMAAEISRDQGRITACGMVSLDVPRQEFFKKELKVVVSRATGPGKFDPLYENRGIDYPLPYVRWTTQRNMECFLSLVAEQRVKLEKLVSHRFKLDEALAGYEMLLSGKEPYLGVLLEYGQKSEPKRKVALSSNVQSSPTKVEGTIALGLIGAGLHANTSLLPTLKSFKDVKLVGLADAEGFKGRHTAQKYGFAYCTTDYHELLKDNNINLVLIATRHNLHAQMVQDSFAAGKHVFVEKPLAMKLEELKQIKEVYIKSGRQLMVGFNRRFAPHTLMAKELLGKTDNLVINCRVNAGFVPGDSWIHDASEGGGRVIGEVCHFVDLLQTLTNSSPVEVFAKATDKNGGDNLVITLKFANGSIGTITYASQGDRILPRERIEVFAGSSVCVIDNFKNLFYAKDGKIVKKKAFSLDRGYAGEFKALFSSLRDGGVAIPFDSQLLTTLTTFAIIKSIKSGHSQEITLDDLVHSTQEKICIY